MGSNVKASLSMGQNEKFQKMGQTLQKGAIAGMISGALLTSPANAYMDPAVAALEAQIPMINGTGKAKDPPANLEEFNRQFDQLNPEQQK